MKSGIYKIENLVDGKVYIGSSITLERRLSDHRRLLNQKRHGNKHLQRAWDKYGEENFKFSIVKVCDKDENIQLEQYYIDKLNACDNGYNISPTAGSSLGRLHSEETKRKITLKATGRINGPCTEERKNKISQAHIGKKQTEEHNRNAVLGRLKNDNYKQSKETKRKISKALKGRKKPEGFGDRISVALKGKPKSPEHRLHLIGCRNKGMAAGVTL